MKPMRLPIPRSLPRQLRVMPGDIRSSGCGSTGGGRHARPASLQSIRASNQLKERTAACLCAHEESYDASVANCLAPNSFRLVFFKEIGKVANESHNCHYY